MSCCFKPQKEKYEFGGDSDQKVHIRKQSAKVQKRHSKILTGEVAFTPSPTNDDSKAPQKEEPLAEQRENGGHMSTNSSKTVQNSMKTDGDTEVKLPTESTEVKSSGVTVIEISEEDMNSSSTSGTSGGKHRTETEDTREASLTPDKDKNQDNGVDGDKNNNVKIGELQMPNRMSRLSATEGTNNLDSETGESNTNVSVKSSGSHKMDGPRIEINGQAKEADKQDIYREPPTDVKSFDDWKADSKEDGDMPEDPAPDYSDPENEDKDEDYTELRKNVRNRISKILTREEWDQIVAKADKLPDDVEVDIPEPDYEGAPKTTRPLGRSHTFHAGAEHKKTVLNPAMDSKVRHDLHREMMMNQKLGIDVLHKKSELTRELEKRKEREKSKKPEYERKNSFDIKMQEMANKVRQHEEKEKLKASDKIVEDDESQPEFLRIHSKINRHKSDS